MFGGMGHFFGGVKGGIFGTDAAGATDYNNYGTRRPPLDTDEAITASELFFIDPFRYIGRFFGD